MKRLFIKVISVFLTITILFTCQCPLTLSSFAATISTQKLSTLVDGVKKTVSYKVKDGELYIGPNTLTKVLKNTEKPFTSQLIKNKSITADSIKISKIKYYSLDDIAKAMDLSYTYDKILSSVYIWTNLPYSQVSADAQRAYDYKLITKKQLENFDGQISPKSFANILIKVIKKLEPTKVEQFKKNVKPALTTTRAIYCGEAFIMAYYAAECVGAVIHNSIYNFNNEIGNSFFDTEGLDIEGLFPNAYTTKTKWDDGSEWDDYRVAAYLWSVWYSSPYNDKLVFDFDSEKVSMRPTEKLTMDEAVCAAVRIFDITGVPDTVASINSTKALSPNSAIITDELLERAVALPEINSENYKPYGFAFAQACSYEGLDKDNRELGKMETEEDIRRIANWGFDSVQLALDYWALFSKDVSECNITNLEKLDRFIAAGIKYGVHINLVFTTLPGRWRRMSHTTGETIAEVDLFTSEERKQELYRLWGLLAERYKEVPNAVLSFYPIRSMWGNLSSGLPYEQPPENEMVDYVDSLIGHIRTIDPDRLITYEVSSLPNDYYQRSIDQAKPYVKCMESKYKNTIPMFNYVEEAFVYSNITTDDQANMDIQSLSIFKPVYPTYIYSAKRCLWDGQTMSFTGELVKGTRLDLYLKAVWGNGTLKITADGETLYTEVLPNEVYEAGMPLSARYAYAKSNKKISVTLDKDYEKMKIEYVCPTPLYHDYYLEWSGMDIVLPDEYAVERWWFPTDYGNMLSGKNEVAGLRKTSTIMLNPNSEDSGLNIVINPDVTYTSEKIYSEASPRTMENWAKSLTTAFSDFAVRMENTHFNSGVVHSAMLAYYKDTYRILKKYGIGSYNSEYGLMTMEYNSYVGRTAVLYDGEYLDVELLKIIQKYKY